PRGDRRGVTAELLAVGRVSRAHGIGGEVSVLPLTEVKARFAIGSKLQLEDGRTLTVETSRPHQKAQLVKFEEIADRNEAESLRGQVLLVSSDETPQAPTDSFWIHQVVGLEVVTEDGRSLGVIKDVESNPANDLWVTEDGTLIPAVREVVIDVDIESGKVTVRDLPGLTSPD
ncbi:MAG: ribosome maturation factor RimM, partial [Actinomycetota bacterium]